MSKGLEALNRIGEFQVDKTYALKTNENIDIFHYKTVKELVPQYFATIEKELKEYEMEHTLRIRLENINYELVREKQENEKKLKALEIIKKAFNSSSTYTYKLEDSLDCGWITQEEYDLAKEVLGEK